MKEVYSTSTPILHIKLAMLTDFDLPAKKNEFILCFK